MYLGGYRQGALSERLYDVSFPSGEITGGLNGGLNKSEEALMLQYLSQASGVPSAGHWISFAELPNGMLHDIPFKVEVTRPLAQLFDRRPDDLIRAANWVGGQDIRLSGDVSIAVPVFPRILVAVILWVGDEEFRPGPICCSTPPPQSTFPRPPSTCWAAAS